LRFHLCQPMLEVEEMLLQALSFGAVGPLLKALLGQAIFSYQRPDIERLSNSGERAHMDACLAIAGPLSAFLLITKHVRLGDIPEYGCCAGHWRPPAEM